MLMGDLEKHNLVSKSVLKDLILRSDNNEEDIKHIFI